MRLIGIVLGEETAKIRNAEASTLMDYGFSNKKVQSIKKEDDLVKKIKLDKATSQYINIYPKYDINIVQDKGVRNKKYNTDVKINKIKLPLKKGDVVGSLTVRDGNKELYTGDLIVKEDVQTLNFFDLFLDNLKGTVMGEI